MLAMVRDVRWLDQSTNTSGALRLMHRDMFVEVKGDRKDAPNLAIIITDGEPTVDIIQTSPEIKAAKQKGIVILAIGIGNNVKNETIDEIATDPDEEHAYHVSNFAALKGIETKIESALCDIKVGQCQWYYLTGIYRCGFIALF